MAKTLFSCSHLEEDNVTKSLIDIFKYSESYLLRRFLKKLGISNLRITKGDVDYILREKTGGSTTIPDAWIQSDKFVICFENKISGKMDYIQMLNHLMQLKEKHQRTKILLGVTKHKNDVSISDVKKLKKHAKKWGVKAIFLSWYDDITRFILRESTKASKTEKAYFLLNEFRDYLRELNLLKIEGFSKKDLESLNNKKHPLKEKRKKLIIQNLKPKLKQFRDMLIPVFDGYGLPSKGKINYDLYQPYNAQVPWIRFCQKNENASVIHYSLVLFYNSITFILHLRPGNNKKHLIKNIEQDNCKKLYNLLIDISKNTKNYTIIVYTGEGNEDDNKVYQQIDDTLTKEKLRTIISFFKNYEDSKLNIERSFDIGGTQDQKIIWDGNKLLKKVTEDIVLLKPLFEYMYKFR